MILIDSSVWIDWLRGTDTDAVRFVQARQDVEELALTQMIYLEVLQGASTDRQYEAIKRVLSKQTMLEPLDSLETFEAAAQLYRTAWRKGLTVRKPVDCLIAAIALEQRVLQIGRAHV